VGKASVLARITILLVDDHGDSRNALRIWLESAGARVLEAPDGEYALGVASTLVPDVIISDLRLPRVDGFTLARTIQARATAKRVRLIAVTGVEGPEARAAAREAGFDDYLLKPVNAEELILLVRRLIDSGRTDRKPQPGGRL
jgi:DNA-binding response OmpR family regulator